MDEDTIDLIRLLCTRAGMIMEDMSAVAIMMPINDGAAVRIALAKLSVAADSIQALLSAAKSLTADDG